MDGIMSDNNFKGYIDNLSIDEKPPAAKFWRV